MVNKIANTTWKVAGNKGSNISGVVPKTAYTNEITSPNKGDYGTEDTYGPSDSSKIGLMYVSDYGYAASQSTWTTTLANYNGSVNGSTITSLNWMYLGMDEWTITRDSGGSVQDLYVVSSGCVSYYYGNGTYRGYGFAVRPEFYLNSSVTYVSGSGTSTSPYHITD